MTFDIGIIKLITTWLIFRTIDGYEISTEPVTWDEIDNVCKQHFLPELFTDDVKDGLTKSLPKNEKFWLHAKSRPTNYLIWRGCHRVDLSDKNFRKHHLKNNSVSSCVSKTNCVMESTIALKGDTCFCIEGPYNPADFPFPSQTESDQTCPGNLNEDCGCPGNLYSFYGLTEESGTRGMGDCITKTLSDRQNKPIQTTRNCDDKITNAYQCWNRKYSQFYSNKDGNITWLEARRLCLRNNGELGGNKDTSDDDKGREYWTPVRSSFQLLWTGLSGYSDKQCVAVVNSGVLQLTENDCSSSFRAVCEMSGQRTETKFPVLVVIIAAVGGVLVLCVVILGIVCWKRRNRGRKRSPTVSNRLYDQVVCSNVPTKKPAQPKPGQDSNQGECSYVYQSVDPLDVNNTTSNEGHYDVTFIHSNNTHTLPVASGNIYDRCYGKSTGTPIDRNTYDNAESGHSFSVSKDVDHYDTTRNVQPKSGAKICSEGDYDTVTDTSSCNRDA